MTFYCLFIFVFVNVCVLLHVHFDSLSLGLFSAFYVILPVAIVLKSWMFQSFPFVSTCING